MRCGTCGTGLDRPGDFCLECQEANTTAVVLELTRSEAILRMLDGEAELGTTTITTVEEPAAGTDGDRRVERHRRSYVERIAGELRRKRPQAVYLFGDHDLIQRVRSQIAVPIYRIDGSEPLAAYRERATDGSLTVVEEPAEAKLGGRHTTVIGERAGHRALRTAAEHPNVKKVIPGAIDGSGRGASGGFEAKITRPTDDGNLRMLLVDGSSVQEVRIVTTASNHHDGDRIGERLNAALASNSAT